MSGKRGTVAERLWSRVERAGDCWVWQGATLAFGHGVIGIGQSRTALTHRVVWELTYGPIPEGLIVCHHCDNPPCVRPSHLFLGTKADNSRDMKVKGRHRGPNQLPQEHVLAIALRLKAGEASSALAAEYGVHHSTIRRIATGKNWGYLTGLAA